MKLNINHLHVYLKSYILIANKEKYIYKFKEDTKFAFEIGKSGYVKEIKI